MLFYHEVLINQRHDIKKNHKSVNLRVFSESNNKYINIKLFLYVGRTIKIFQETSGVC